MSKIFLCFLISGTVAQVAFDVITPVPSALENIHETSQNCINEVNADPDILKKYLVGTYEDNELTKNFIYCFLTKASYGDADGFLIKENILSVVGEYKNKDVLGNIIEECNRESLTDIDVIQRVYRVSNCFHEKTPIKFKVW